MAKTNQGHMKDRVNNLVDNRHRPAYPSYNVIRNLINAGASCGNCKLFSVKFVNSDQGNCLESGYKYRYNICKNHQWRDMVTLNSESTNQKQK